MHWLRTHRSGSDMRVRLWCSAGWCRAHTFSQGLISWSLPIHILAMLLAQSDFPFCAAHTFGSGMTRVLTLGLSGSIIARIILCVCGMLGMGGRLHDHTFTRQMGYFSKASEPPRS